MAYHNRVRWIVPMSLLAHLNALLKCAEKHRHRTRSRAEANLRQLERRFGPQAPNLQPYECPLCGAWHLGHWKWIPMESVRRGERRLN